MSKAYLFSVNSSAQTLTGGGAVNVGSPVHGFGRTCCNRTIDVSGDSITLRACGYYDIDVAATVTASEAADVTVSAYIDGTAVPGVSATETIAAADDPASVALTFGVRVPACSSSIVTLVVTSTAGNPTVSNIATTVEML